MANRCVKIGFILVISFLIFIVLITTEFRLNLFTDIYYPYGYDIRTSHRNFTIENIYHFKRCQTNETQCDTAGLPFNVSRDMMNNINFPMTTQEMLILNHTNVHDFVFVTAASENHFKESLDAIATVQKCFPGRKIIYYDIGLSTLNSATVRKVCDVEVRKFNFSLFPEHVSKLKQYAWKAIVIYEALTEYTGVFWIDASIRFLTDNQTLLRERLNQVYNDVLKHDGMLLFNSAGHNNYIVAHPRTFKYLPTDTDMQKKLTQYESNAMLIYRTESIYKNVIYWFTICALQRECFAPTGSTVDCFVYKTDEFNRPLICHRYDQLCINIILQNHYKFQTENFVSRVVLQHVARDSKNQFWAKRCTQD